MPCSLLNILGGVFEAFGLGLTVMEFMRVERRVFPERRGGVRRALLRLLKRLRPAGGPRTIPANLEGTLTATGTLTADLSVGRAPTLTLEERVSRLEHVVEDVRREDQERAARLSERITEARQSASEQAGQLQQQLNALDAARREELDASLLLQKIGVGLFAVGVVCSTLGNVLPC